MARAAALKVKERKVLLAEDSEDEWNEQRYSDSDSDDDFAHTTTTGKTHTKRKRTTKVSTTTATKKRARTAKSDTTQLDSHTSTTTPTSTPTLACHRTHTIHDPHNFRRALLKWYLTVRDNRGMPWRVPFDHTWSHEQRAQRAYEVWISEVMLQQTQVATVIPYYNRWMSTFPTLSSLAQANIEEVNALWKGLGYYTRASRLLQGAQKAVKDHDGKLPHKATDLQKSIPGIGRYSAGAICSIAYNESVPVLDGNVHRLLSRILALHAPPKSKSTLDVLWDAAESVLPKKQKTKSNKEEQEENPGDVNQALIELGSTICKVSQPDCTACPVNEYCYAYNDSVGQDVQDIEEIVPECSICVPIPEDNKDVTIYPMKAIKKKAREEIDIVHVVEWRPLKSSDDDESWFLLVRRPEKGLLAGLYEFPSITLPSSEGAEQEHEQQPWLKFFSNASSGTVTIQKSRPVGDVLHIFSHIRKTYRVKWVLIQSRLDEIPDIKDAPPTTNATKKKGDKKGGKNASESQSQAGVHAKWIKLEDVQNANIGTGMVKVWNLVQECRRRST